MFLEGSTPITHSTEISSIGVLPADYKPQWNQKLPDKVTQAIQNSVVDFGKLDSSIFSLADSLEELLVKFLLILHNRSCLAQTNQRLEELLKRYIVAVVAVSCIEKEKLDHTLEISVALPKLPTDGVGELVSYVDDIFDFYSHLHDPTSASTTVEVFTVELKQSHTRTDTPSIVQGEE